VAEYGGAIGNFLYSMPTLISNIFWGNAAGVSGSEVFNDSGSTAYIRYCDIEGSGGSGGVWESQIGTDQGGNIDADPLFVDPTNQDYHLQYLSPCIDAGDPFFDYSAEPEPNGGRINMGTYGGTPEASISFVKGGVDGDEEADLADAIITLQTMSKMETLAPT